MPTFREDAKIGSKVPLIKTADLNDKSVTERKLADGSITQEKIFNSSVTTEKLANESVSAEKLQSGLRSTIVSTHDKTIELDKKKANVTDVDYALECLENKIGDRVVVEGNVTNLPDDEDLTSVSTIDGREVMKLNDRAYEPSNFSGKGYKILRKNIQRLNLPTVTILVSNIPSFSGDITITVNGKATTVSLDVATDTTTTIIATKIGTALKSSLDDYDVSVSSNTIVLTRNNSKYASPSSIDVGNTTAGISVKDSITKSERKNVLTQNMIDKPNTIYEIRYNFDLNGAEITLPENCVLKFNGGILRNGVVKEVNINANKYSRIFDNVVVDSDNVYVTWFDDIDNIKKDATKAFKAALKRSSNDIYKTIYIPKGNYVVSDTIECMNVAIIGDSSYRENIKITFDSNEDVPLFFIRDKNNTVLSRFTLKNIYIRGKDISTLDRAGIGILNDKSAPSLKLTIENCEIQKFSIGIKVSCLISSIVKDTYIGYNSDGIIFYNSGISIGTSTTFNNCYIQANLRHVTIEPKSMIDVRFVNGTIIEAAKNYAIYVKGGLSFLLIDQCYFEANSYGYDWNGAIQNDDDVKENILWVEADTDDVSARFYTYVISNSIVSGSNNWNKLGKVITANAGTFQVTNNVFSRFKTIFDLVSGYTKPFPRFSINFNSSYFGGNGAAILSKESWNLVHYTFDNINIKYTSSSLIANDWTTPANLRNTNDFLDTGIESNPGVQGAVNTISLKFEKECIASFNKRGVAIIGNTNSRHSAEANAYSNSLCLLNGNDLLAGINHRFDDKLHSYLQSAVEGSQTRFVDYTYRSDTDKFEKKYILDFSVISSDELINKDPSIYRYITYYIKDKNLFAVSNGTDWVDFAGIPVSISNSGTFSQKPSATTGIKIGFNYFCTDRQTEEGNSPGIMLYYKGNDVWVDALGRIIN